jgi:hypothetical protein
MVLPFHFCQIVAIVLLLLSFPSGVASSAAGVSVGPDGFLQTAVGTSFSVPALLNLLSPVEALDIAAAHELVKNATPEDPAALARATVGRVPLLHYLVGLLPRLENAAAARQSLASVVARLAALGADVNAEHPSPSDPSLLYKV